MLNVQTQGAAAQQTKHKHKHEMINTRLICPIQRHKERLHNDEYQFYIYHDNEQTASYFAGVRCQQQVYATDCWNYPRPCAVQRVSDTVNSYIHRDEYVISVRENLYQLVSVV